MKQIRLLMAGVAGLFPVLTAFAAPPTWIKMPMLTPQQAAAGISPGGEGTQWPRGPIVVSPADPNFLLLPIDVGGLYRSLDGGKNWEVAMVGWNARGANAFAIDPKNASHVLGIGSNSMDWNPDWGASPLGLYLSTDKAASWKQVLAARNCYSGAVAFDPSSFDKAKGMCLRAYYLLPAGGLLRTENGGTTWARLSPGAVIHTPDREWFRGGTTPALLCVDSKGRVYTAGVEGVFASDDHGKTFAKLRDGETFGLSLTPDDTVYTCDAASLYVSRDRGHSFTALSTQGIERPSDGTINGIVASPVDPKRLLCWVATTGSPEYPSFDWPRYISRDGGASWRKSPTDFAHIPLLQAGREGYSTWSPVDADVAWSIGGDWASKSTDGGRSFRWFNNGYNGVMTGGLFNFNPFTPNKVLLGFQDYNSSYTTDGGKIWAYHDLSGRGWGGHEYGAYALDDDVMWSGDADSWNTPRRLRMSRNGGRTWAFVPDTDGKPMLFQGTDVSFGDPSDSRVGFAGSLRTANEGNSWQHMTACDAVFAFDTVTQALLGKSGNAIVRSVDHGVSWTKVADVTGGFVDLAVDPERGRIYVASEDRLKVWESNTLRTIDTPRDQYGNSRVWTVATDPQDPLVVYVGAPRNTYSTHATVCRSTDGGKTWRNLTITTPIGNGVVDGPHEVTAIRVHPITREAWVAGECYGLWRIPAPAKGETGVSATQASAPPAPVVPSVTDLPTAP